jgi:hypothetical protein
MNVEGIAIVGTDGITIGGIVSVGTTGIGIDGIVIVGSVIVGSVTGSVTAELAGALTPRNACITSARTEAPRANLAPILQLRRGRNLIMWPLLGSIHSCEGVRPGRSTLLRGPSRRSDTSLWCPLWRAVS